MDEMAELFGGPFDGKIVTAHAGTKVWHVSVPCALPSFEVTDSDPEFAAPRWGLRVYHYVRDGKLLGGRPTFRYSK